MTFNWTWQPGRSGSSTYTKLLIAQGSWWDCWLIKYPPKEGLALHKDAAPPGKRHFRLNVRLWGPDSFVHYGPPTDPVFKWWRVLLFRPDIILHGVTVNLNDPRGRLILSIGWVR